MQLQARVLESLEDGPDRGTMCESPRAQQELHEECDTNAKEGTQEDPRPPTLPFPTPLRTKRRLPNSLRQHSDAGHCLGSTRLSTLRTRPRGPANTSSRRTADERRPQHYATHTPLAVS